MDEAQTLISLNGVNIDVFQELREMTWDMDVENGLAYLTKLCDIVEQYRDGGNIDPNVLLWSWTEVDAFEAELRAWKKPDEVHAVAGAERDDDPASGYTAYLPSGAPHHPHSHEWTMCDQRATELYEAMVLSARHSESRQPEEADATLGASTSEN